MAISLQDVRSNKPLRNLVLLAILTVVAIVASIVAVSVQEHGVRTQFTPVQMYPGLETKLDQVSKVTYTLARGMRASETVTLIRGADRKWTVAERKGYPARQDFVQKVLIGVSELVLYEPRTARPEWHRNLGLLAPEDLGSATRVEFFDKDGKKVVSMLAGKVPEQTVDARGEGMIYVRRDGENQSWLARGRFPLVQSAQDWLDQTFLDVSRDEIKRVTLWAGSDHPVVMSRASKDENDFTLQGIPKGRTTRGAPIVNGAATAIVDLTFDDTAPVDTMNFPDTSPKAVFETFDGVKLTLTMTGGGGALWAKVEAVADPALVAPGTDMKAAEAKAAAITARTATWAYKLPQTAGGQLTQSMDLLTHEGGLPE
ncbi:MAG TPA: DUF4340 domain-containing protein [Parvibaculum sp.]